MSHWFVVGWMVTVLWGNGGLEEARTDWSHVFYGTAEQCQAEAGGLLLAEKQKASNLSPSVRDHSAKHATMPQRYSGGIIWLKPMSAFCAPFNSADEIKEAFPKGWDAMSGMRAKADGSLEAFRWWDGPDGAAFTK